MLKPNGYDEETILEITSSEIITDPLSWIWVIYCLLSAIGVPPNHIGAYLHHIFC